MAWFFLILLALYTCIHTYFTLWRHRRTGLQLETLRWEIWHLQQDEQQTWKAFEQIVQRLIRLEAETSHASHVQFYLGGVKVDKMANLQIGKKYTASIAVTDAQGNAAAVVGVPVWSQTDESLATLAPAADGMSCVVTPAKVGSGQLQVKVEGDATPGVDTVIGTADMSIVSAEAAFVSIAFDAGSAV